HCSSEITSKYKQQLINGNSLCDLTGGLGVDSYYFSLIADKVIYVEQNKRYCEAAQNNFSVLQRDNIEVIHGNCMDMIDALPAVDCFYIDPARRGENNSRLFAIDQCEPNILNLKDRLLKKSSRVIIKVSPMIDITASLALLPETIEVHINSVRNECKEILFILSEIGDSQEPIIICNNLSKDNNSSFTFVQSEEKVTKVDFTSTVGEYIYEPNASIMMAGGYKAFANRFGLLKLHSNSHLYTSVNIDTNVPFHARGFRIVEIMPLDKSTLKNIKKKYPQANIAVRNSIFTVEEFRKRSNIKEGGELYMFVTTLYNEDSVIIIGRKVG
ncbi:MAG: THUMP-like domain-containing protein, partial [Bacteroidales bacterium]